MHPTSSTAPPNGLAAISTNSMPIPGPDHLSDTAPTKEEISSIEVATAMPHPVSNSEVPPKTVMSDYLLSSLASARDVSRAFKPVDRLHGLPEELIIEIFAMVIEDEPNKAVILLRLARLSRATSVLVHGAQSLWARAFETVETTAQLDKVRQLAGLHHLNMRCSSYIPDKVKNDIPHARAIKVTTYEGEEWIQYFNDRKLPLLRDFESPDYFQTTLVIRTSLLALATGGPTFFPDDIGNSLRRLRLQYGFGIQSFPTQFRSLLSSCPHLEDLHIDRRHGNYEKRCWQMLLEPLNDSGVRELRLDDDDRQRAPEVFAHEQLRLPNLELLITHSVLWVKSPKLLHAEVSTRDFADLESMAPHISSAQYLGITISDLSYEQSSFPTGDTTKRDLIFPRLRTLRCDSTLDANFLKFIEKGSFPLAPSLQMRIVIPSNPAQSEDDAMKSWTRRPLEQNRSAMQSQMEALNCLRSMISQSSGQGRKITIKTDVIVGGHPSFVFSLESEEKDLPRIMREQLPFADVRFYVSVDETRLKSSNWDCLPVTPGYVLSALTMADVTGLHMPLHLDVPERPDEARCWGSNSLSKAADVDIKGMLFNLWTPPDALAAPHPSDFKILCKNMSVMTEIQMLKIEVVHSNEERGVGVLRALIAMDAEELERGGSATATCPRLENIILETKNSDHRTPVALAGKLKDEIEQLKITRRRLARQGCCVEPSFSFSPEFCPSGSRASNAVYIPTDQPLQGWST